MGTASAPDMREAIERGGVHLGKAELRQMATMFSNAAESPNDTPEERNEKKQIQMRCFLRVAGIADSQFDAAGMITQDAVYWGPAPRWDGRLRCQVLHAGRLMTCFLMPESAGVADEAPVSLLPDPVPGQHLELSVDGTEVVALVPEIPRHGEVLYVSSVVELEDGDRWLNLGEGFDVHRRARVSGFLTEAIPVGGAVLVDGLFAYELLSATRGGEILHVTSYEVLDDGRRAVYVKDDHDRERNVVVSDYVSDEMISEGVPVRVSRDFVYALVQAHATKQSHFLEECRFVPDGRVSFDDILGQDAAAEALQLEAERFLGQEIYSGIEMLDSNTQYLLSGPPGNGKSQMLLALADLLTEELGDEIRCYVIRSGQILDKWLGNSEANTRALFEQPMRDFAERGIRSLIAFEEFDGIAGDRGETSDSTGAHRNIVNTLLTYLDGFERLPGVFILCITNYRDLVDPGLLRPKRLGGYHEIEVRRLGSDATCRIVRRRIEMATPGLITGAPDAFVDAARHAMELSYGNAIFRNDTTPITGNFLTSGAAAAGAVEAAVNRLHLHLFRMRRTGKTTPFTQLSPMLVYHGMRATLRQVMGTIAGSRNIRKARRFLAGTPPFSAEEMENLAQVDVVEGLDAPPEEEYDISTLEELERAAAGNA